MNICFIYAEIFFHTKTLKLQKLDIIYWMLVNNFNVSFNFGDKKPLEFQKIVTLPLYQIFLILSKTFASIIKKAYSDLAFISEWSLLILTSLYWHIVWATSLLNIGILTFKNSNNFVVSFWIPFVLSEWWLFLFFNEIIYWNK